MSTTSPRPMPEGGLRALSPREGMQRLKALSCTTANIGERRCSGQMHIGVFFDGTGNNKQQDYDSRPPEKRKHTNVVRLFLAHPDTPSQGYFAHYVPGVGTPFPEIGDVNRTLPLGKPMGEKGEHRIIWALFQVINSVHGYVHGGRLILPDQQKSIVNNIASLAAPAAQRRSALRHWQTKLQAALAGAKPTVEQINISVFGFSRGAAESRAFCNWLFDACQPEGGGWTFAGIPLRVSFMGVFDTVASVGQANLFDNGILRGHASWADNNLEIHPGVERCVHFVAGHEVRACFPLDSVRVKSRYPGNALEVMYPGAHSDVGGGYAPGALGIASQPGDLYSLIPAANMYKEARLSGVPLKPLAELPPQDRAALQPAADTIRRFNDYVRHAKVGVSAVENMLKQHMALYFSYRFKHRHAFESTALFQRATAADKGSLRRTQATLIRRLGQLGQGDPMAPDFNPREAARRVRAMHTASGMPHMADHRLCDVAESIDLSRLTPEVESFLESCVHDSMAGAIGEGIDEFTLNGIGLAKFRTVFKGND